MAEKDKEVKRMEVHIYKNGDEVRVEGKGSVSEIREDALRLAKDIDETIVAPRLKQLAEDLRAYIGK
ncbi:MAG: hypothetical protein JRD89_04450 [Deltaproteobacteria bacterium]|nr:hypothetical protein [Deltaproteobacteria bacterium]